MPPEDDLRAPASSTGWFVESTSAEPQRRSGAPVDPRLLRYARASRGFFAAITAISLLQTVVIVLFAWLLTRAIDGVVHGMPRPELIATLGALVSVVVVRSALIWAREWVAARAAAAVELQLRSRLIDAVGALGPEWLSTRNSAQLAITAGHGLDALDAYFGRYLPQLVQTVVATPVILAVMWWQDWLSGLTVLLTLPLIPLFMVLIGLATRSVQNAQWSTLHTLAVRFTDTVQGLATLKVFGRQHRAVASIEAVTDRYRRETMRVLRVSFLSGFALEFLASISVAIVAVSIGFRLLDGSLTLLVGLFVLLLAPEAYLPIRQVGVQFHAAAEGVAATEDIFGVLDAAASAPSPRSAAGVPAVSAGAVLTLQDVRVRWGGRLLPSVSLEVGPGSLTLIEGPSGSGKSSLLAALRGAASFEGTARWHGSDVRDLAPSEWLAWAGQQPGLIAGSVAHNVALGDPTPDPAIIRRALALGCAADIDPQQDLGVQGAGLSGGQAQRVAVARAVYRHLRGFASVLALDEPSAALDADTERMLWNSVRSLAADGAVVLLVSHRESARRIADAVVRLETSEVAA
ncbi:thiol reductant ABC exporter subunit CydD [Microbacterium sp. P02]|uniref:thiol reductant ABC exporter subunit CydD n=1 Tax=Microbacterium sp. P02 TaxID=3366260 RepID=UPI00366D438D